jgi:hypothetical protein
MTYTHSPFSVFLVGDVMHVSWPHRGISKEDLYIELCNTKSPSQSLLLIIAIL